MFAADLPCKLLAPKIVTVDANHNIVRHVVLRLQTELTDEVAAGIGGAAKMARDALLAGELKSCRFDLGAIAAVVDVAGVRFKDARGVRAAAKINKGSEDEEPAPEVVLEFEAPWTDEALVAVALACNQSVTARIERQQISLLDKE